jgi:hypothetical protein
MSYAGSNRGQDYSSAAYCQPCAEFLQQCHVDFGVGDYRHQNVFAGGLFLCQKVASSAELTFKVHRISSKKATPWLLLPAGHSTRRLLRLPPYQRTEASDRIGVRLGLYKAMDGSGPMTSADFADKANISERYAREWLAQKRGLGLLEL